MREPTTLDAVLYAKVLGGNAPSDAVLFTPMNLSDAEKAVARANINAGEPLSSAEIANAAATWLAANMTNPSNPAIDASLSVSGAAADAKAAGDAIGSVTEKMTLVVCENLLDPSKASANTFLNGSTGATSSNNTYFTTGYMPVQEGDVVRCFNTALTLVTLRTSAFYKEDKTFISGTASNQSSSTAPAGAKYVRFCVSTADPAERMCLLNVETPQLFVPFFGPYYTVNIDGGTDFTSEYLDYSNVNRLDPAACEIGKFLNGTTGAISDNANYFVTNYIPIYPGETLYILSAADLKPGEHRTVAYYDRNKTLISGGNSTASADGIPFVAKAAYIRCTIYYIANSEFTPTFRFVLPTASPVKFTGYGAKPQVKQDYLPRKDVYIRSTDTEAQIIEKLVNAYRLGNCDVRFDRAEYTFGTVLPTVRTLYSLNENEIPVGNGCRYFFNGAKLTATIDLGTYGSDFYCNLFGCQRWPTSFEMYDGILTATDTRYVMHDEASGKSGTYRHLYRNMYLQYITDDSTDAYRKCIGGGTGESGVVDIDGCKFVTDSTAPAVSYHGNSTDVEGAAFDISVKNSWFSNTFGAHALSEHQTAKLLFTGNSTGASIVTSAGWDVTSFLNEVRT